MIDPTAPRNVVYDMPQSVSQHMSKSLSDALDRCRMMAESASLSEYEAVVAECAAELAGDPAARQYFLLHAQAMRHAVLNRRLDAEVQRLQGYIGAFTEALERWHASLSPVQGLAPPLDGHDPEALEAALSIGLEGDDVPPLARQSLAGLADWMRAYRRELIDGAQVQQMLLPQHTEWVTEAAQLAWYYRPATGLSGDWLASYSLPERRILVVVGDVTGHGPGAAILTASVKSMLDEFMLNQTESSPAEILQHLNSRFSALTGGDMHMSCVASVIDPVERSIITASAGHPFPYRMRATDGKLDRILARGSLLGTEAELAFTEVRYEVAPGDVFLWYSDGVVECAHRDGSHFGNRGLRRLLDDLTGMSNAAQVRDAIVQALAKFCAGSVAGDDITFMVGCALPMAQ